MKNKYLPQVFVSKSVVMVTVLASILCLGSNVAHAQLDPTSYTSLGTLTAGNTDVVNIDTTTGIITINGSTAFTSAVTQPQTGAGSIRVFDFSSINIAAGATVTVTGTDALGLLSQGNASVLTTLDASGTAGSAVLGSTTPGTAVLGGGNGGAGTGVSGAAASAGVSTLNGNGGQALQNPNPALGGQDGAGGGLGGPGGAGGSTAGNAVGVSPLTKLVGGGGGSGGPFANTTMDGDNEPGAGGGAGGGAIEIIATGSLTVSSLNSNGGTGGGVVPADGGLQYGGGGAGGAIVLGGSSLTVTGAINANGGAAVPNTLSGAGGGGEVALINTPSWVLGSTTALGGLGINVNVNRGVGGSANGTAGTIQAQTLGVTAPIGQTATFNGTNFTNVIPVQTQDAATPAITVTLGHNLILNGGTLQFTGTNETFGPTNTFQVTANDGTVDTQGFNDTISSVITGNGAIFKEGTGSLTLTNNANVLSGGVAIYQGTLIDAGSTALGTGGITQAGGILESNDINHTIGMTTGFNMVGGELVINLNGAPGAASNDQVNVTAGGAVLQGNLTINYHAAPIPAGTSETYTIVTTTGGVSSAGTGFTDPTIHSGALVLNATGEIVGDDFDVTITSTQGLFSTIGGLTPNQINVATYIDRIDASGVTNPGLASLIKNLDTVSVNSPALGAALNQLMPLNFAQFASSTAFNGTDYLVEEMDNYLADHRGPNGTFLGSNGGVDFSNLTLSDANTAHGLEQIHNRLLAWNPAPSTGLLSDSPSPLIGGIDMKDAKMMTTEPANLWNVFVAGDVVLGQDFSDNHTGNAHDDSTSSEVRVGADYAVTPNLILGAIFNYDHTDVTLDAQHSSATVDGYMPGVYASYAEGGWYANAIGTYAFNNYTQQRNVAFEGFDGSANSAPSGDQILGDLDGGYDFRSGHLTYGPTAGVKYIHLDVNGYSETGLPAANLDVDRDESDSLRGRLGGRVSYVFNDGSTVFTPHLDASWQHEFLDSGRNISSQFTGIGAGAFDVRTENPSRESALITVGLDAQINKMMTLFGNYTVQAGQDNYFGQAIQAGLKISF